MSKEKEITTLLLKREELKTAVNKINGNKKKDISIKDYLLNQIENIDNQLDSLYNQEKNLFT